ncbi:MAG: DUF2069 domain-containing protein [Acidiferrobacterales bacterium]|nr:DUF2069 domain-containing protein [Acidiferrobacterales bacterium]
MITLLTIGTRQWHQLAIAAYLLLILTILVWESWGAPARQASVYYGLLLKTIPLALLLPGILRRRVMAHMTATLLMLLYFTEGVVLTYSEQDQGWHLHSELFYAATETFLSVAYIVSAGMFIRMQGKNRENR